MRVTWGRGGAKSEEGSKHRALRPRSEWELGSWKWGGGGGGELGGGAVRGEAARAAALTCCCRSGRPSAWRPRCTGGTRGHLLGFRNGSAELSLRSQVKRKCYHHITCPGCNPQVLASGDGAGTPPLLMVPEGAAQTGAVPRAAWTTPWRWWCSLSPKTALG